MSPTRAAVWLLAALLPVLAGCGRGVGTDISAPPPTELQAFQPTEADWAFLDSLQRDNFNYFWDLAHPVSGLHPDRHPNQPDFCSIAAVGFGLSAYVVGVDQGYVSRAAAAARTLQVLRFLAALPQGASAEGKAGYRGFFYHFLHIETGLRYNRRVELSSIDTGLLLMGALTAQQFFDGTEATEVEIRALADTLYRRVEWDWMVVRSPLLRMGWKPGSGFLRAVWDGYNEAMLLYVLALGSPTHPVDSTTWSAWTDTYEWGSFAGSQPHVNFSPLFGHQYSHMWIDFRGLQDEYMRQQGIDYFENSRRGTYSNYQYCLANPGEWVGYGPDFWGLTACDGPATNNRRIRVDGRARRFFDYRARGASLVEVVDDGTIAPTAAGGSIPFAPEITVPFLRRLKARYGSRLYGPYGFRDAVNLTYPVAGDTSRTEPWIGPDYLGIDQGPFVLQIANYRNALLWRLLRQNPYVRRGLQRAGFTGGWLQTAQ